jgi:hypothetical protein
MKLLRWFTLAAVIWFTLGLLGCGRNEEAVLPTGRMPPPKGEPGRMEMPKIEPQKK